jgi:hypothetical protein
MSVTFRNVNVNTCSTARGWTIVTYVSIDWRCTGGYVIVSWASCGIYGRYIGHYTLLVKLSDFTVWRHIWRKSWVNCAVLTGNSAGLRNVLSSHLSHRVLRSSLKESDSFLSLPADTTMASSQGTQNSSNSFSRWASHDIPLLTPRFTLSFFLFG